MTVAELIEKLKAMPQDAPIVVMEDGLEYLESEPELRPWCWLDEEDTLRVVAIWNR